MHRLLSLTLLACLAGCVAPGAVPAVREDIPLFDFESGTWEGWDVDTGTFGPRPVSAEDQDGWGPRRPVGWQGRYMAATATARHDTHPDGQIASRPFTIERRHLTFLLAGELHPRVRVVLEVDGGAVREAFGNNAYDLFRRGWDVGDLQGVQARLVVEDRAARRSMIRVDDFRLTDTAPPELTSFDVERREESTLVRAGEFRLRLDSYQLGDGQAIYHHRIVWGHDDRWHLFGAAGAEADEWDLTKVRRLVHASTDDLNRGSWTPPAVVFEADPAHGEAFVNDPDVTYHQGTYYLFFVGSGVGFGGWNDGCQFEHGRGLVATSGCTHGPFSIHLATSSDGVTWTRRGVVVTDTPFTASPAVHRIGEEWVMYYGAAEPATAMGRHAIAYRTSDDLLAWSAERRIALLDASRTTPWPEHPFIRYPQVFRRGAEWYLLAGSINNDNLSRYHVLWPFRSRDPYGWEYSPTPPHGRLFVDGGAQVVRDLDGGWHITSGNVMARGIWLAPLAWDDGADDADTSVPLPRRTQTR